MKKRTICFLVGLVLLNFFSSCAKGQRKELSDRLPTDRKEVLIVYLSRTNNTKAIAEIIQKQVGGRLVALELVNPYPKDYLAIVAQVAKENETGYFPPLKTRIDSLANYDIIFLGFPTWGMQLPPPIKNFLKQYDLSVKTIIPFNTNGGYGVGSSFQIIKELCLDSNVLEGFSIRGGLERDGQYLIIEGEKAAQAETQVKEWLQKIDMIK